MSSDRPSTLTRTSKPAPYRRPEPKAGLTPERALPAPGGAVSGILETLREQLPEGAIMLLRRRGFYEAFGRDAGIVSRVLCQPSTTVQFQDGPLAMFSIQVHKGEMYARKIASATGQTVVLCDAYAGAALNATKTTYVDAGK